MGHLDGNVLAGPLAAVFGRDMTTARGRCQRCGHAAEFARLVVYVRAPGTVARCPACGVVVLVIVESHGEVHVHMPCTAIIDDE